MATLRIRIYNVLFGDAVLVTIPEVDEEGRDVEVNVLFDVGNALAGAAGDDRVFDTVLGDIQAVLGGRPLNLYVMTHEHMDHVQGPLLGSRKLGIELKAQRVWMTASSAEDYYRRFVEARKQRAIAAALYKGIAAFLRASASPPPPHVSALLEINNPRASKDCVDFIRKLASAAPLYVHREAVIDGQHPFRRTKVRVLAPEEDTAVYYGRLGPRTMGAMWADGATTPAGACLPPRGVSAGHFFDLVRFRTDGMAANLRTIDKAANNSSIALELEWEGWRLLFPGDAEEKSWKLMSRAGLLRPVHFLKVSHHGSSNGSPEVVFETVLPERSHDGRPRKAVVSTFDGTYSGVPDQHTLSRIAARTSLHDTRDIAPGSWIDLTFDSIR